MSHICVSRSVVSDSFDPVDCSPPGYSVHGILQAGIVERVAMPFSRGSSWPRDQTQVSHIAGRLFTIWASRGAPVCISVSEGFSGGGGHQDGMWALHLVFCLYHQPSLLFFLNMFIYLIYLTVPALSCGMQMLSCSMWNLVPWPGTEPGHSSLGVQSFSHIPPGNFQTFLLYPSFILSVLKTFPLMKVKPKHFNSDFESLMFTF